MAEVTTSFRRTAPIPDTRGRSPADWGDTFHRVISVDNIARAARVIDPVFRNTPQFEADALGDAIGARLVIKVETINPIRSFKGRGTDFFVRELRERPARLVCASAGNFGQGLAFAARKNGIVCEVFVAEDANPLKVERIRALGAEVWLGGRDFDDAKAAAREYAAQSGGRFVEDGRETSVAEGAGTIALELCAWPESFETVLVPLGNGALLGGMASWIVATAPNTRVVGVCAAAAPSMEQSWRAGRIIETDSALTIADGIAVRVPIPYALETLADVVDDIVLVNEDSLREATRLLWDRLGLVIEPAGAAGIAALLEQRSALAHGLVATPLCGGNLSPSQLRELMD